MSFEVLFLQNTSAVELRSGLSCPQTLLLQRERQISNVDASLDLLLFGTSDVGRGRNRLVGGSVSFGVSRVLHTAQATESRNSVKQPNLPMVVIDHCIPGFCCYP